MDCCGLLVASQIFLLLFILAFFLHIVYTIVHLSHSENCFLVSALLPRFGLIGMLLVPNKIIGLPMLTCLALIVLIASVFPL